MAQLNGLVCIFDLDGTLVDSAPDLTAALNRALLREGLCEVDESEARPLVGEGARALLRKGFAMQGRTFPEGTEGDRMVADYIDDYASRISEHSRAFPGVEACLTELIERGAVLAVCTNKVERLAEPLLSDLGLRRFFVEVVAQDSLPEKKPSPLPLRTIMQRTGCARAVMVGDTATDHLAAKAAGVTSIVATFGYGADDPRVADAVRFSSYKELLPLIEERF